MHKLLLRSVLGIIAAAPLLSAAPVVTGVVNGASYGTRLAPGTWAAIFGTSLADTTATASSVPLGTSLGGVTVSIGGIAAPMYYVSPTQINVVIPFESPNSGTTVPVLVTTASGTSAAFNIVLWQDAPALFTRDGSGTGPALAFDANFKPVTAIGSTPIVLYATGLGATNPAGSSSSGGVSVPPFNTIKDPLTVTVGGAPATVGFAGLAPGFPGIYQLNVTPTAQSSSFVFLNQNTCTSTASGFTCVGGQGITNSNTTTIGAGSNVTNLKGTIDGIYPATGPNIAAEGANPTRPGSSLGVSVAFLGANFTLDFDVVQNAKPFSISASIPGVNTAVISIDPVHGTWQGTVPSPTAASRRGDFSGLLPTTVLDFLTCNAQGQNCFALPGNILPPSRQDTVLLKALETVPLPTSSPIGINGTAAVSGTLTGNHFHWESSVGFGGFTTIAYNGPSPSIRSVTFTLQVDGLIVGTTTGTYRAY